MGLIMDNPFVRVGIVCAMCVKINRRQFTISSPKFNKHIMYHAMQILSHNNQQRNYDLSLISEV